MIGQEESNDIRAKRIASQLKQNFRFMIFGIGLFLVALLVTVAFSIGPVFPKNTSPDPPVVDQDLIDAFSEFENKGNSK